VKSSKSPILQGDFAAADQTANRGERQGRGLTSCGTVPRHSLY
jgi:hypothetical protein